MSKLRTNSCEECKGRVEMAPRQNVSFVIRAEHVDPTLPAHIRDHMDKLRQTLAREVYNFVSYVQGHNDTEEAVPPGSFSFFEEHLGRPFVTAHCRFVLSIKAQIPTRENRAFLTAWLNGILDRAVATIPEMVGSELSGTVTPFRATRKRQSPRMAEIPDHWVLPSDNPDDSA